MHVYRHKGYKNVVLLWDLRELKHVIKEACWSGHMTITTQICEILN